MKRLLVVYNPRSSHYGRIRKGVIDVLKERKDWTLAKYEIGQMDVDENAVELAKIIQDGDLVIAAGGDGTAAATLNGVMMTKAKDVRFGVLGFGNFNDTARSFGEPKLEEILRREPTEVWPLECRINGKLWRYGMCYVTVGMFAVACGVFDHPKTRHALRKGNKRVTFSIGVLARWWLKCRKMQKFLPEKFELVNSSDEAVEVKGASDYLAVNGLTVAKLMKGGRWFMKPDVFLSKTGRLTRFGGLFGFMSRSVLRKVPGVDSDYDKLVFAEPTEVMVQAEGEYERIADVTTIEIRKSKKPLLAIMRK